MELLIDINEIELNGKQSVKSIKGLQNHIQKFGLMMPLIVTKIENGKYLLVDGVHRYMACKNLGMKKIKVIIK